MKPGRIGFLRPWLVALLGALPVLVQAHDPSKCLSVDAPGGSNTTLARINNQGHIVGSNDAGSFLLNQSGFSPIAFPKASSTMAGGINTLGQIVGTYTSTGNTPANHGFLRSGGEYIPLDDPDVPGVTDTNFMAINDRGQMVGYYITTETNGSEITRTAHGFLYSQGNYTTINVEGAINTYARDINRWGQVVGYYEDAPGSWRGFIWSGGNVTTFEFPYPALPNTPYQDTYAFGINDLGQIVGAYSIDGVYHGYILSGGTYTPFDAPFTGATSTLIQDINTRGQIVGFYYVTNPQTGEPESHGFVCQ